MLGRYMTGFLFYNKGQLNFRLNTTEIGRQDDGFLGTDHRCVGFAEEDGFMRNRKRALFRVDAIVPRQSNDLPRSGKRWKKFALLKRQNTVGRGALLDKLNDSRKQGWLKAADVEQGLNAGCRHDWPVRSVRFKGVQGSRKVNAVSVSPCQNYFFM